MRTSESRGTFSRTSVSGVSRLAIIKGSAAFFAPEMGIDPLSLLPPTILMRSMDDFARLLARRMRAGRGVLLPRACWQGKQEPHQPRGSGLPGLCGEFSAPASGWAAGRWHVAGLGLPLLQVGAQGFGKPRLPLCRVIRASHGGQFGCCDVLP